MARLLVQARNNEDTPTTCVRLCTSIENVEMLQHQENDERCRDGQGISRVGQKQNVAFHGATRRSYFELSLLFSIF